MTCIDDNRQYVKRYTLYLMEKNDEIVAVV